MQHAGQLRLRLISSIVHSPKLSVEMATSIPAVAIVTSEAAASCSVTPGMFVDAAAFTEKVPAEQASLSYSPVVAGLGNTRRLLVSAAKLAPAATNEATTPPEGEVSYTSLGKRIPAEEASVITTQ